MDIYSPSSLLRPGDVDKTGLFIPVECSGDTEAFSRIRYVQVHKRGLIFCSEQKEALLEKQFNHLDDDFQKNKRRIRRIVELPACPRIRDDNLIQFILTAENAELLDKAVASASPPEGRRGTLPTEIYVCGASHTATLLPTHHALYTVIDSIFTLLAFTGLAAIFTPIVHWSVDPLFNTLPSSSLSKKPSINGCRANRRLVSSSCSAKAMSRSFSAI
ncbi:hypothetical protein C8F01DRAFT_735655 [Mycena amicta]|nr:hypothetical protein C8F01DRAFT_735655 [Mycena amicta]